MTSGDAYGVLLSVTKRYAATRPESANSRTNCLTRSIRLVGSRLTYPNGSNFTVSMFMGDLAFGMSCHMLESSEEHWAIKLLNEGIQPLAYMLPSGFFGSCLAFSAPGSDSGLTEDWWKFIAYCRSRVVERMQTRPLMPDIMSALLQPYEKHPLTKDGCKCSMVTRSSSSLGGECKIGHRIIASTSLSVFLPKC